MDERSPSRPRLLYVPAATPPEAIVQGLGLMAPRGVLILNGDAAPLPAALVAFLGRLLGDGLARLAAEEHLTAISGGTTAGVFGLLGAGFARWGRTAAHQGQIISFDIRQDAIELRALLAQLLRIALPS
ncbi:MAG TPA: hypothetical protein VKY74_18855 [Chloroflexia bacterium]|nr:hypothetical protein [Chloroflexia bacterium]